MEDLNIFKTIFENNFLPLLNLKGHYPDRVLQKLYALCRSEKFALKCLKLFQIEKDKLPPVTWESFAVSQLLSNILSIISNNKAVEPFLINSPITESEIYYIRDGLELITIHLKDNKLPLIINLEMPKEHILKEIDNIITLLKKPKGRGKTGNYELPFQVWDIHKLGNSYWQITQELFPDVRDQDPITDDKAKAVYEKVQRAYKKAHNLIREIDENFPE